MIEDNPKKKKRSKGINTPNSLSEKQTKEEKMIAKYLMSKLPHREGKLVHDVVSIFDGNEAVNALLASRWATGSNKYPLLFANRHYAIQYLKIMMIKNFFHRASKVKKKVRKKLEDKTNSNKKKLSNDELESKSKESKKKSKEGKKARMKLEIHEDQTFNPDDAESDDIYVWIYEPFSAWRFLLGVLILLVILGLCLLPIWPSQLRTLTYYGSFGVLGVLGVLLALVAIRAILFMLIWVLTLGRHHFWLLPNLTEDCGVLESFKPLYQYEYVKQKSKKSKLKDKGKYSVEVDGDLKKSEDPAEWPSDPVVSIDNGMVCDDLKKIQ